MSGAPPLREVDGQIDGVLAKEFSNVRLVTPGGEQEGDVLVSERVGQTFDPGHFINVRAAVRCPESQEIPPSP